MKTEILSFQKGPQGALAAVGARQAAGVISGSFLLDQLGAVVDGRPVEQGHVLFVRLPDIISGFHQLLAAFQDSKPDTSHTQNTHTTHTRLR